VDSFVEDHIYLGSRELDDLSLSNMERVNYWQIITMNGGSGSKSLEAL
jgi:hypothetical protein